jgi:hypothetical protein
VLPFTIFADAQRRIVALKVGELHADEAEFILDRIAALNAGRERSSGPAGDRRETGDAGGEPRAAGGRAGVCRPGEG